MKTDNNYRIDLPEPNKNRRLIALEGVYTMFEAKRGPAFYFGGECHAAWEMVYILDGSVGVSADDKVYTLNAGDVIFHQPMEFHKIWSEGGESPRTFILSFDASGELLYRLKKGVYRLWEAPRAVMDALFVLLYGMFGAPDGEPGERDYISLFAGDAQLQVVLSLIESFLLSLAVSDKRTLAADTGEKVRLYTEIVGLLESNVYGKITIPEIAERLGVSGATVKKCFADYAGCGIHKYFLQIKIRTAIELLRGGKTVSEVSELLQFSNPNYFSIVFKRETGGKTACSYRRGGGSVPLQFTRGKLS